MQRIAFFYYALFLFVISTLIPILFYFSDLETNLEQKVMIAMICILGYCTGILSYLKYKDKV